MINSEEELIDFLKRQCPGEEIGIAGPGTWAPFTHCHPAGIISLFGKCEFYYFDLDGTKVFMSPWAKEGEINFTEGSFAITGLDFVRI